MKDPTLVSVAVPEPEEEKLNELELIEISSPAKNVDVAVNCIEDSKANNVLPSHASSVIINSVEFVIGTSRTNENDSSSILIRVNAISPSVKTVCENDLRLVKIRVKNRIIFKVFEKYFFFIARLGIDYCLKYNSFKSKKEEEISRLIDFLFF